jgi:hypothetical protein
MSTTITITTGDEVTIVETSDTTATTIEVVGNVISGGGSVWGAIGGTLSDQTDLVTELTNAKARANHTGTQSADTLTDGTTNKAFLAAERTKLAGIATGATANSSDATLLDRANHTGTQSADTLTDGTTNKAYTATERTKLSGIATGATANDTDANLKNRANHTGTQLAATISDFQATVSANTDVAAMKAIIGDGVSDGDAVVDTLAEMLTTFQTYSEGVDIATTLASKASAASLSTHIADTANPHSVTKTQVGLGNVDNTSDATKNSASVTLTNKTISGASNTLSNIAQSSVTNLTTDLSGKQATLVSGTNIKTVNGTTLLGSGDLVISAGSVSDWGDIGGTLSDQTDLQAALDDKADATDLTTHTSDTSNPHSVTKTQVGLGNVDNTSDAGKPVSTATQTALDLKAPLASPTFTGTVSGITKSMVGLGNVDNTADTAKPVSTAQQTALDLKANLASPALTGTPTAPTAATTTNTTQVATTAFVQQELTAETINFDATYFGGDGESGTPFYPLMDSTPTDGSVLPVTSNGVFDAIAAIGGGDWGDIGGTLSDQTDLQTALDAKAPLASPTFTGTVAGITKSMVGLGNVDNTADTAKPVSTAQQTALDLKANLASPTFTGTVTIPNGAVLGTPASATLTNASGLPQSGVTSLTSDLALKAPLASPTFTGTPAAPTAAAGTSTTQVATTAFVQQEKMGYTLQAKLSVIGVSIVDAGTYYWGGAIINTTTTTAGIKRLYIPKTGTIKVCYIYIHASTPGSAENSTLYIRLNNTTDTLVSSAVPMNNTSNVASNTGLSIAVVQGDYIEFKLVAATFATNPSIAAETTVYIE